MDSGHWDNGSYDHAQCSLKNLKKLAKPIQIGFAEDRTTLVDMIETFEISKDITLKNFLQVPSFNVNLMSVSQLTKDKPYSRI